jgi:hypothetical protein
MSTLVIEDKPMSCCGLVMGSGFDKSIRETPPSVDPKTNSYIFGKYRYPNKSDFESMFLELEDYKEDFGRNCALISLSSEQKTALEVAKQRGYKVIFEFYNPNSGNQVYLLVKTRWDSFEEYRASEDNGDDD